MNYVIGGWTGARRADAHDDGVFYLREHIACLRKYRHDLAQITVMIPHNPDESLEAAVHLENLHGTNVQNTPVVVMRRENVGLSYGSFSHAYGRYRDEFDYYIFIEDDYVFVRDYFDKAMVRMFESRENCGYLCQLVEVVAEDRHDASMPHGISRQDVLAKIWAERGELPHSDNAPGPRVYSVKAQTQFSEAFMRADYRLCDFEGEFRVPYLRPPDAKVYELVEGPEEYMVKPIQMVASRDEPRVNCVVAAWSGPRVGDEHPDGLFYLRQNLKQLGTCIHDLSQITVVTADNQDISPENAAFLDGLDGSKVQDAPVVVLRRENAGYSYGSYSHAFEQYRSHFDYYIFIEDDYAFVQDHFDKTMVRIFEDKEDCGYLCQLVAGAGAAGAHAGVSNGISRRDVLTDVWAKNGQLVYRGFHGNSRGNITQRRFSEAFIQAGHTLCDFSDVFRVPFFESSTREIQERSQKADEYIIKPTQMLFSREDEDDPTV